MKTLLITFTAVAVNMIFFCQITAGGQKTNLAKKRDLAYEKRADKVFREVWHQICLRNYDKKLNKIKQNVFAKYLPLAKKCSSDKQLAAVLNRMIRQQIGQSHISVLPPLNSSFRQAMKASLQQPEKFSSRTKLQSRNNANSDDPADVGLVPCCIDNKLFVLRLRRGFPAELAGIKPGDQIIAVNGIRLSPDKPAPVSWSKITSLMLSGCPGSTVEITLRRSTEIFSVKLKRRKNGFKWFKLGVMPKLFSDFEVKMLPGKIGYIRFSAFLPEDIAKISRVINNELKESNGLIVDLRDNVGGMILTTQWLAGWIYPEPIAIGTLKLNGATLKPVSCPQPGGYKKPLAILINDGSFSCAELFPAAMQDAKAAKIFGSPTLGKCLPSQFLSLPSGFRLQTVFGDHLRANGKRVEGVGVTPDILVKPDPVELRNGRDAVIETARNYLAKIISK